ncbi:MAG: hypothetical protein JNL28_17175 [Planctomycetes bacterium]|nr:hypothetical protein [Planctomycetota bacterium]
MKTWILCLCALLSTSCGYEAGLRVAEKHKSVGVEFFGNDSRERDVERPLYEEITRALRDLTDLPIESPQRAEVVIQGTVRNYQRRSGVRSRDNQLLETGVLIEAEASLIERASGRALGPPVRAGHWIGYVLDDPGNEARARERVLRQIADELVLELFAPVN